MKEVCLCIRRLVGLGDCERGKEKWGKAPGGRWIEGGKWKSRGEKYGKRDGKVGEKGWEEVISSERGSEKRGLTVCVHTHPV